MEINISEAVALLSALVGLATSIVAVINHIRAKNYHQAAVDSDKAGSEFMRVIDAFKKSLPQSRRDNVLSVLGEKLEDAGLKAGVDAKLRALGLNEHK